MDDKSITNNTFFVFVAVNRPDTAIYPIALADGSLAPLCYRLSIYFAAKNNMRTLKTFILASLVMATTGTFIACKKNNNKKKNCELVEANIPGSGDILFSYNSDGKVSKAGIGVGSVNTFSYKGDSVIVLNTDSGVFQSKNTYAINSAGLATYQRTEYDQTGTNWTIVNYEYNSDELSKSTTTSSSGVAPTVSTYTWFDHNMVAQTSGTTTTVYEYYTDKPEQSGDYLAFTQLIQGATIVRNKNLLKSITGSTFNYAFNSDGNISALEITGTGSAAVFNYTYQCN